jgi:hypothetical protein
MIMHSLYDLALTVLYAITTLIVEDWTSAIERKSQMESIFRFYTHLVDAMR